MDARELIKNQTHAGLNMLRQCVVDCPEALWVSGQHPRMYWKIAYHVVAYAHMYQYKSLRAWPKWEHHRKEAMWTYAARPEDVPVLVPYTQAQVAEYLARVQGDVDHRIDAIDLDEPCGFSWYKGISMGELLVINIRHISVHVGQLHEIRLAAGLDVRWTSSRNR